MNSSSSQPGTSSASTGRPRASHRRDIDGLRGLAIALVVVFHVFVGRVSSGVDVFLLVGGIFFFAPQIRNALNPAGLTVVQSFLRILRRLYPALITVVAATLVLAVVVYAEVRWVNAGNDASASLLYIQNFHLASEGQEYTAINRDVSLYQHIWSMSVQMQIYLGSLLVIALLATLFRKKAKLGTNLLHLLLVIGTAASFGYATWLGQHDQAVNYYSPFSRFWEIGLGGLFGIWLLGIAIPRSLRWLRWPAGLAGLALIIATGLFLDGAAQFPGPWTLLPLAGAMLVIFAGNPESDTSDASDPSAAAGEKLPAPSTGVSRLLDGRIFQFLGRTSYSLYLWHWPLLTLATFWFSTSTASQAGGLRGITATLGPLNGALVGTGVIALSLLLAWLTHRFVETPLRQKKKPHHSWVLFDRGYWRASLRSRGKVVATLVIVLVTGAVFAFGPVAQARIDNRARELGVQDVDPAEYPGPNAFLQDADVPDGLPVLPDPSDDAPMLANTLKDGCLAHFGHTDLVMTKWFNEEDEPCAYGDLESDRTMYLVGGSHSEHYLPALERIAKQRNFKIVPILKLGCVIGMDIPKWDGSDYPECREWQKKAEDFIFENPPSEGIFMTVTRPTTIEGDGPDQVPNEYVEMVRKLSDAGIHTWGVRDTPWVLDSPGVQGNARLCVAEDRGDEDCGVDEEESLAPVNPALAAYRGLDLTNIDVTDAVCRDGRCPGVVGNVLVYRDAQHFTNLFAAMLAPEISRQMYDPEALEETEREQEASPGPDSPDGEVQKDVFRLPKPGEEDGADGADGGDGGASDPVPDPAPDQGWVDPGYVDPGYGYQDPGYVDPGYGYQDPGYVDPGYGYAPQW
ncbi:MULTISPECIES: acyltransferase family protein [unclassified Corynebacterium]|uniref:acyltransferase family protein n=1 Tax=unclassified Corynebacterium TaxID=2624378 RepID=UPI0026471F6F|nr:acyltransferase family protein [Corynebacterium sp.]MDN5582733.1 acyltransferase [Corynebacterium sp.]MDN5719546.1 acyltransferase [Corynebacterium sp.]